MMKVSTWPMVSQLESYQMSSGGAMTFDIFWTLEYSRVSGASSQQGVVFRPAQQKKMVPCNPGTLGLQSWFTIEAFAWCTVTTDFLRMACDIEIFDRPDTETTSRYIFCWAIQHLSGCATTCNVTVIGSPEPLVKEKKLGACSRWKNLGLHCPLWNVLCKIKGSDVCIFPFSRQVQKCQNVCKMLKRLEGLIRAAHEFWKDNRQHLAAFAAFSSRQDMLVSLRASRRSEYSTLIFR